MSKSQRIEKRINRIENRFRNKVASGRKGTDMDIELHERRIKELKNKISPLGFSMPHSPLNKKDEFDIDYSGVKPVELGNISDKEATKKLNQKFVKAKNKFLNKHYPEYRNVDSEYKQEKGGFFYEPVEDKIKTSYLEYPEEAAHIGNDKFLGKNWSEDSPLDKKKRKKYTDEEWYAAKDKQCGEGYMYLGKSRGCVPIKGAK